jgi:hypothetical protein
VAGLLADRSKIPDEPGIYAWWFKDALPEIPLDGTLPLDGHHLLYVGIAPRKPRHQGQKAGAHCAGVSCAIIWGTGWASSTLRRSLAMLLKSGLDLDISRNTADKLVMSRSDEDRLTDWLIANAAVTIPPSPNHGNSKLPSSLKALPSRSTSPDHLIPSGRGCRVEGFPMKNFHDYRPAVQPYFGKTRAGNCPESPTLLSHRH